MALRQAVWLLWLLLLLALRGPSARAEVTTDRLRMAVSMARDGDPDGAIQTLPPAPAMDRSHLSLLWDAVSALRESRPATAAHLLAAIRRLDPESSRPRVALEDFWAQRPALGTLYPDDLWLFPVDAEMMALAASPVQPAATVATVSPRPFLPLPPATHPRSGKPYNRAVTVYVDRKDVLALRFVVHFTGAVDESRARQAGKFLGALSVLSDRMLGPVSRAAYPVHVWLTPDGRPGAEQWAGSITIHGATAPRSSLEWARELSHEWGHATLPGIEGFVEPEVWADGDLGERLYLPKMADAGWLVAWGGDLDVAPYTRRYVDPLRDAFARTGPVPKRIKDVARDGFDHLLGAVLYIDAAFGTPALVAALEDMEGRRSADFLAAFQRTLGKRPAWTMRRAERTAGAVVTCFPVAGEYILEGRGVRRGKTPVAGAVRFPAGWSLLEWSGTLTVRPTGRPTSGKVGPGRPVSGRPGTAS